MERIDKAICRKGLTRAVTDLIAEGTRKPDRSSGDAAVLRAIEAAAEVAKTTDREVELTYTEIDDEGE